jgi:head-tail adaptor
MKNLKIACTTNRPSVVVRSTVSATKKIHPEVKALNLKAQMNDDNNNYFSHISCVVVTHANDFTIHNNSRVYNETYSPK